jgi:hypothetical protein
MTIKTKEDVDALVQRYGESMFGSPAERQLAGTGLVGGGLGGGTARESGSPERFRSRRPANIPQAEWDKLIDRLVSEYKRGEGKATWDKEGMRSNRLGRMTLEDVLKEGQRGGEVTGGPSANQDRATELAGAARNQINENNRRLGLADAASWEADQGEEQALAGLKGAQDTASQAFHGVAARQRADANAANQNSRNIVAGLGGEFAKLNAQDQNALADYLKATDPQMAEIMARSSDPADLQRELDAYSQQQGVADKYKDLTDPQVTAKERYMSELARREFESADKSNREAVSEQLANRGLRSGGQQIAMQQGMQQQLSQDRLLKELGIQAGAVDRSMKAMEGWNTATNNLSVTAGAIRSANDSQRQYEDEFKAKEAKRISDLAGQRNTATNTTTSQVGGRAETLAGKGLEVEGDVYNRNKDSNSVDWDVAGKDYGMAGDYYTGAVNKLGRKVGRANTNLTQGTTVGGQNFNMLADALSLGADADADKEEWRLANSY